MKPIELSISSKTAAAVTATPVVSFKPLAPVYIPFGYKILFSCCSAVTATLFTHPFDVVKVLLQIQTDATSSASKVKGAALQSVRDIVKQNGFGSLYGGITAAVLRQVLYGSSRLALFDSFMAYYTQPDGTPPSVEKKLVFAGTAGAIGALIGNPADMTLVRMAADSKLPLDQRRNYGNVFNALIRIKNEEGMLAWWKGSAPTVARCVVVNVSQLTTYAQAKQELLKRGIIKTDGMTCHVAASMLAGFVATFATQPMDVVKTRIQNMKGNQYSGMADCFTKIVRNEGVFALWKGFTAGYARMAPQTTIMFVLLEQLKSFYQKMAAPSY